MSKKNFKIYLNYSIVIYIFWLVYEFTILHSLKLDRNAELANYWWFFCSLSLLACVFLLINLFKKISYLALYLFIVLIVHQFPSATELHFQYLGWTFVFLFLKEFSSEKDTDKFLRTIYWFCFGSFYSYLGIVKLFSEIWLSGNGIKWLLLWGPWRSFVYTHFMNEQFYKMNALFLALIQAVAIVGVWHSKTKKIIWSALTIFQVGLALTTDFYHIALGVLIFHFLGYILIIENELSITQSN